MGRDMKKYRAVAVLTSVCVLAAVALVGFYTGGKENSGEYYVDLSEADPEPEPKMKLNEDTGERTEQEQKESEDEKQETAAGSVTAKNYTEEAARRGVDDLDATIPVTDESVEIKNRIDKVGNFSFGESSSLIWPVDGKVLMNYSMDKTVLFKTLNQYKYNPAVLIQSDVNAPVKSACRGKVSNVEFNEETGITLTVDAGDGYRLIYGQLKEVPVSTGSIVESGEIIGYVGEVTKYYSSEGTNLYFAMTKNDVPQNPFDYMDMTGEE